MTSTLFGPKGALLVATSLMLAACTAGPEKDMDAPVVDDQAAVENSNDGRPGSVDMTGVEADALDNASPYGLASQDSLTAFAGDRVYFGYDSSELSAEAREDLQKQYDWLSHHSDVNIVIEGHCDERGTREYNLALGERRATAVKNYLSALGLSASRMSTISYGKERPAVVGAGEQSWGQNRRGVLVVQ